jgi:TonB family protein
MPHFCKGVSVLVHALVVAAISCAPVADLDVPKFLRPPLDTIRIETMPHYQLPPPAPLTITPRGPRNPDATPLVEPIGIRPDTHRLPVASAFDEREDSRIWPGRCGCVTPLAPPVRISGAMPLYPARAVATRVEGMVVVTLTIANDGSVESAQVVSGAPMFQRATLEAVQQWRFRPTLFDGRTVAANATVIFVFQWDE